RLFSFMVTVVTIFDFSVERIPIQFLRFIINCYRFIFFGLPVIFTSFKSWDFFKFSNRFLYFILIKQINSTTFVYIRQFVWINSYKNFLPGSFCFAQQQLFHCFALFLVFVKSINRIS